MKADTAMASIEFNPVDELLILRGLGSSVRHPLLAAFTRQAGGGVGEDGVLQIPTRQPELTARYQTLARLLGKLGIEVETGGHVSDVLDRVETDERAFAGFAQAASDIWNAKIDTEDFRRFVEVVEARCPGRVFYRKQLLSAFHLAFSQNACNFSVPGAGKTSVVYAAYAYLSSLGRSDSRLIRHLFVVWVSSIRGYGRRSRGDPRTRQALSCRQGRGPGLLPRLRPVAGAGADLSADRRHRRL